MTDTRKLLEDAALAAGLAVDPNTKTAARWTVRAPSGDLLDWNPLTDDGDAMRLSCTLSIDVMHRMVDGPRVEALAPGGRLIVEHCHARGRCAATRLAIVRAAAQIGAAMGEKNDG